MLYTRPIPIDAVNDNDKKFIFGSRCKYLLSLPFDNEVLKKRVLRKKKDGTKGEAAYYIDLRDLVERLDLVVGWNNWSNHQEIIDSHDRVIVKSMIHIGTTTRTGESEDLKTYKRWNKDDKKFEEATNEIAVLKCGPNATKRAAALFGVGAYLYNFANVNTWEEINDWGQLKNPNIDIQSLPSWAIPPSGKLVLLNEMAANQKEPLGAKFQDFDPELVKKYIAIIENKFSITKEQLANLSNKDLLQLSGVIARFTDSGQNIESVIDE